MPDELDDLLRRAIKTLDDQLPSGYFDTLSSRTLARLESSMETGTADHDPSSEVPPSGVAEEDSGLHDIRSLARSTKERISSKRIPLDRPSDEDLLATSSASWKAVALPEPAKMVSLPSVEDLPSARAKHAATSAAVSHPNAPVARRSRY
ncbi:MAG TPA: hypothetical protein VLX92_34595, partial [Kofleriaceae bacterium]|nr:hypothetical protein [Kofleriaceae bacterium]